MQAFEFSVRAKSIQIPTWMLLLLFLVYALPGNIGHAPWRGEDVLNIQVSYDILKNAQWLTPKLAGLFYIDRGPLSYWFGALTGMSLSWMLPVHDAIRFSSVLALGLQLLFLRGCARNLYGQEAGTATLLLMLGTLGLLVHAHEMQPLLILTTCMAANLYGVSKIKTTPLTGALISGAATGLAFLAGGLTGLVFSAPVFISAFFLHPEHRKQLAFGALPLLVFTLSWPLLLSIKAPDYIAAWWVDQLGRAFPHGEHLQRLRSLGSLIGWFCWPLWPIALWSLWHRRGQYLTFGHALPLVGCLTALILVSTTGAMKPANMLPLLPPLALIASAETCRLRRGAANAFDWFGIMTFSLLGIFLWLAWNGLNHGWPPALARNIIRLAPGYQASWRWEEIAIAGLLSIGWIAAIVKMPFFQLRGALHGALGITLCWGLATTLWLPWFDQDRNYQAISEKIAAAIAAPTTPKTSCIAGEGIPASLQAGLKYFNDIDLETKVGAKERCGFLLSYAARKKALPEPGEGWFLVLTLGPKNTPAQDRYVLYRKTSDQN